jgi:AraC-like DNA-binding protein
MDCISEWQPERELRHDEYLLHFVKKGKGLFDTGLDIYELQPHDAFMMRPGVVYTYKADEINPWSYYWISLAGAYVHSIFAHELNKQTSPTRRIEKFNDVEVLFKKLRDYEVADDVYDGLFYDMTVSAILYHFARGRPVNALVNHINIRTDDIQSQSEQRYITNAEGFVALYYSQDISVKDIANFVGLSRTYLTRIFTKHLNVGPGEYINQYRVERAKMLLINTKKSIKEISHETGFNYTHYFTAFFKRSTGLTPTDYREKHISGGK